MPICCKFHTYARCTDIKYSLPACGILPNPIILCITKLSFAVTVHLAWTNHPSHRQAQRAGTTLLPEKEARRICGVSFRAGKERRTPDVAYGPRQPRHGSAYEGRRRL